MPRLLLLTPAELTRDPRARRAAVAAQALGCGGRRPLRHASRRRGAGAELAGVSVIAPAARRRTDRHRRTAVGDRRARAERGVLPRELRGLYQLAAARAAHVAALRAGRPPARPLRRRARERPRHAAGGVPRSRGAARARLVYDAHELLHGVRARPAADLPRRRSRALERSARAARGRGRDRQRRRSPTSSSRGGACGVEPIVVLNCPELERASSSAPHEPAALRAIYQARRRAPAAGSRTCSRQPPRADGVHIDAARHPLRPRRAAEARSPRGLDDRVAVARPGASRASSSQALAALRRRARHRPAARR